MKKKRIIKIALWTAGIAFLLFTGLVVHIAMVLPKNSDTRVRQLSRIDFEQPVDSAEAGKIQGFVAGLEGVESTYFNIPGGKLVYTYTVGRQTSGNVYAALVKHGNYKAQPYVVSPEQLASGCPAGVGKKSVVYRLAQYLSQYF